MQPTRPQITIRDIAERLGISHSTVSRALRNSPLIGKPTVERVKTAAHELGYVADSAARTMRGEPSSLVGLVLPDVRPDFFSALTASFGEACADRGLNLILSLSQHDAGLEETQLRALRGARVAGVLIYPTADLSAGSVRLLKDIPAVQVARCHPDLPKGFVGADDQASMATLVRDLVDLRHRRIAYIGPDPRFCPGLDRLEAFRGTLAALNMPIDDALIRTGLSTSRTGDEAVRALLDLAVRPTALMVGSAPMAEGALDVLQQRSLRVPEDMSFTSFGDPYWHRAWGGGITSVAMPVAEMVQAALSLLLGSSDDPGENRPITVRIPSHVVLRGTTARPKS